MSTNPENIILLPPLEEAFEKVRPYFATVTQDQLLPINTDFFTAVSTARAALPQLLTLRVQLEKLVSFDILNLDYLEIYALALLQAHYLYLAASTPPEHFQELVAEATTLHGMLVSDFTALANRGYLSGTKLDLLQGPVGHRNVASDLIMLSTVLKSNWQKIAGKTGVTMDEINRAQELGVRLNVDIGQRDHAPAAVAAVTLQRQQAFTVFVRAYDQVRRGVGYLRWDEDDAEVFAPSLYTNRKKRSSTEAKLKSTVDPTAGKTEPAAAAADPLATPATKVAVGMPGSDPFIH